MQQRNINRDLKNLLMHFHDDVNFSDHEMQAIFNYLFKNSSYPKQINNPHYRDTLYYLKDLIDLNCFKSIEDIMSYYHSIASNTANELLSTLNDLGREQIIKIQDEINEEFMKYYAKHPHKLSQISPRKYEVFVAELLKDMGYEVWLNNNTKDSGSDIIAVIKTPTNDSIVTLVECKKYSLDNPVPIEIVERLMYTIREKDKANAGLIVTTSTFSSEAQKCQHNYKWQLSLKDNKDLATLCSNYGTWKKTTEGSELWVPDNPLWGEIGTLPLVAG